MTNRRGRRVTSASGASARPPPKERLSIIKEKIKQDFFVATVRGGGLSIVTAAGDNSGAGESSGVVGGGKTRSLRSPGRSVSSSMGARECAGVCVRNVK